MTYQFKTAAELLALCKKHQKPISEIAILREMDFKGRPRSYVLNEMRKVKVVMQEAVKNGIRSEEKAFMNLAGGQAKKIMKMIYSFSVKSTCPANNSINLITFFQ